MQSIGKLDEDYAQVFGHGDKHLAQVFRLRFLAGDRYIALPCQPAKFGHPVHQLADIGPELFFEL
jgi:hypothetical protein